MTTSNDLRNCRLLVLRQPEDSQQLSKLVSNLQGRCLNWPALTLQKTTTPTNEQQQIINQADIFIFISKPAVNFGVEWIEKNQQAQILTVGSGTAGQLKDKSGKIASYPQQENTEGLVEMEALQQINDKNIVVFKGEKGRNSLQQQLVKKGANTTNINLYRRQAATMSATVASRIEAFSPNFVHVTSVAVAQSLDKANQKFKLLDKQNVILLVASERIEKAVVALGFYQTVNLDSMKNEKMIEGLLMALLIEKKG